jgi:hypothetical protein
VDNKCPECKNGDLDMGENGDGRWPLKWKTVKCPTRHSLSMSTQGSNAFYAKVKAEGGPAGVKMMKCNGQLGKLTDDAFWTFQDGSGKNGCGMDCEVHYADGSMMKGKVDKSQLGGGGKC